MSFRQRHRIITAFKGSSIVYSPFLGASVFVSSLRLHLQAWLLTCNIEPISSHAPNPDRCQSNEGAIASCERTVFATPAIV
jgi:hypothetical protein